MEIKELIDLLPEDYEKECYEKKAIMRKRIIKNPLDLMILLLYYLYDNHSLVDVSQFAILKNIGNISDTALIKKFGRKKEAVLFLLLTEALNLKPLDSTLTMNLLHSLRRMQQRRGLVQELK